MLSTISWMNRGVGDNFDTVFGANAGAARTVVDAALMSWQQVITSFNFPTNYHDTFSVNVSMDTTTSGLGASASITAFTSSPRRPVSGNITILHGNSPAGAGWYLDPTPYDSSEFTGTIQNVFVGDAQAGSDAVGQADLFTVVAHEMTHLLGLTSSSSLTGLYNLSTNTGVFDLSEPQQNTTYGYYWVFQGPSIKHLLTSFDSGGGGRDLGRPVHSAPGGSVTYGGQTYNGVLDVVNAYFYPSRRYLVPDTIALILKDSFNYTVALPQSYGTFYDMLESNGELLVRGGSSASNDVINISQSSSTITVSVNIGNDVTGTGAVPGAGNLPAFVSTFSASSVSSINIQAGDGNDSIDISGLGAGIPVSIDGGTGNNTIVIHAPVLSAMTINGGSGGTNTLTFVDVTSSDSLTVNSTQALFGTVAITYSNAAVQLDGGTTITLNSLTVGAAKVTVPQGATTKTLQVNTAFTMDPAGQLDLVRNSLLVLGGDLTTINSLLASGYDLGVWDGLGIMTSAATSTTTLGVGPSGGNILVKYTYYADVNFDGVVNGSDFADMKTGYSLQDFLGRPVAYSDGDLNYDGVINGSDFALAKTVYSLQGLPLTVVTAQAPPPASAMATASPTETIQQPSSPLPADLALSAAAPLFSSRSAARATSLPQVLGEEEDKNGETE